MKLVQGDLSVEFEVVEKVRISGGKPKFVFFETLEGLPKPIKLGRTPREWSFTTEPLDRNRADTLREMFEAGRVCQFVFDEEAYNVIITDFDETDTGEYVEILLRLQEVDTDEVIEVG